MDAAIEAGADDVQSDEEGHAILAAFESIGEVSKALEAALGEAEVGQGRSGSRRTTSPVDEERAQSLMRLVATLEDDDDVQNVYANFEVDEATLGQAQRGVSAVVRITYCTQCHWLLRAAWMAQELLSTFGTELGEVALVPGTGGIFTIACNDRLIWDRKRDGGFPDAAKLKQLRARRDRSRPRPRPCRPQGQDRQRQGLNFPDPANDQASISAPSVRSMA